MLVRKGFSSERDSMSTLIGVAKRSGTVLEIPIRYQRASLSGGAKERFITGLQKLFAILFRSS
jgi:hypothetical protein